MTFDIGAFRTAFPEFADLVKYPTEQLNLWVTLATQMLNQTIWGNTWQLGVSLYVAHEITIAQYNQRIAASGGTPGTFGGIANNKTVGGASVGYDSNATSEKDGGFWNKTTYGQQLYRLIKIFGTRPIQL